MPSTTARTFKSGNSEAVRLPKGYGFGPGTEVRIEREGNRVVLTAAEPEKDWRADLLAMFADIRAITGPDGLPRERRETDVGPERPRM